MPTVEDYAEVGDILALFDTGAYQEVSMNNFNAMPRPASVLVSGNKSSKSLFPNLDFYTGPPPFFFYLSYSALGFFFEESVEIIKGQYEKS